MCIFILLLVLFLQDWSVFNGAFLAIKALVFVSTVKILPLIARLESTRRYWLLRQNNEKNFFFFFLFYYGNNERISNSDGTSNVYQTLIWIQYTKEASLIYDCHENRIYPFKGYMEIINHKYLLMRETERKWTSATKPLTVINERGWGARDCICHKQPRNAEIYNHYFVMRHTI